MKPAPLLGLYRYQNSDMYGMNDMKKKDWSYQWEENIKPLICFFLAGVVIASGFRLAEWVIPAKPIEYQICVQEAGGDFMCEVYK